MSLKITDKKTAEWIEKTGGVDALDTLGVVVDSLVKSAEQDDLLFKQDSVNLANIMETEQKIEHEVEAEQETENTKLTISIDLSTTNSETTDSQSQNTEQSVKKDWYSVYSDIADSLSMLAIKIADADSKAQYSADLLSSVSKAVDGLLNRVAALETAMVSQKSYNPFDITTNDMPVASLATLVSKQLNKKVDSLTASTPVVETDSLLKSKPVETKSEIKHPMDLDADF